MLDCRTVQVIQLVMEVLLLRQNSIEHRLKVLFTEGDDNGDGVLSYEEFNHIVTRYTVVAALLQRLAEKSLPAK